MAKKNKKIRWVIVGAVVLIILLIIFARSGNQEAITVTIEKPVQRTITEIIPANGKIQPVVEVKISPDVSGEIVELNVKEGDYVHQGDLLLKIKQDFYISGRDRAEAQLNSVKAQLAQTTAQFVQIELSYKRNKQLYEQRAISAADFETVESQYNATLSQIEAARFNVKSAKAALNEAQENLVKTTIYAPMNGTVSKLSVEKGERVVGTTQMAGTEMLRIANLDEMEVLVDVNENDIVRVKMRDTAIIEVDAFQNKKFKGIVTQIANSATSTGTSADQVTNFEVKVFILPESYADLKETMPHVFRPGMSSSVSIQTNTKTNTLCVPIQCVTVRADVKVDEKSANNQSDSTATASTSTIDSQEKVFIVQSDNKVKAVKVKTGIQDNTYIEILEGLTDNDNVVSGPYNAISKRLNNGMVVKTQEKPKDNSSKK
jgi:HlyD family secretion protein